MKNIYHKIYIHPFTYIVILMSLFTGYFKELILFFSIIIIHELGHITGALLFHWHIDKIVILPFGGLTKFNELINRPLKEEAIILVMGPLYQLINYFIFKDITPSFNYYNYGLFIFNSLPIYPLDGYKFWSIVFNYFFPFKMTMYVTLNISFIMLFFLFKLDLIYLLIFILLLIGIIKEYRNIEYIYNKFLIERYTHQIHFKRHKIVHNINEMYKDCDHLIKSDKIITEKEALENKYRH